MSRITVTDSLMLDNGAYEIPRSTIVEVLTDMAKEIEMRLLTALWHKNKKTEGGEG